ncbi:phosphatase PAP2 family protein [Sporolactobacillus putidus]|uniref:Phosphatidylglycerophosphatase B n=1 Tax=Sporolactobacillus putidus TaxID=492735 RepID=A0A917S119_9BACL|nr:phosphatase PAP2 family protein [Sporolactobacillus putidus]GGL47857.1 phosphatidylglycerophosphatase B [Sporolactobacillus putidus]
MFSKSVDELYQIECRIFKRINNSYEKRMLNFYFRWITNVGGAVAEILAVLILLLRSHGRLHQTAFASAISLTVSHIIVQLLKRYVPRQRPYLTLEGTKFPENPIADQSFPSGHSTAVFSVIVPLILFKPSLAILLIPVGLSVAVSRIFLGLHYPSDVLAGICLGSLTGLITYVQLSPF